MKRCEIIEKCLQGEMRWVDAAQVLGISDRQLRRLRLSYQVNSIDGLRDMRLGKVPKNRISEETARRVMELYRTTYAGFNVRHFWEELVAEHGIKVGYSWTKNLLLAVGYVERQRKRKQYRRRRERKPMRGMMIHLDGSKHRWFKSADNGMQDMLVFLDDATGEILAGRFVPEESTRTVLELLRELISEQGTFGALYTDRASHFVYTPKAGEGPDRSKKTQVERILDDLGIELICAFSPQARGRSERLWRTLQGRLPQELAKHGITDYDSANHYLQTRFIRKFNKRFAIVPAIEGESAFLPLAGVDAQTIFALRYHRVVGNDHVIRFQNQHLQLPKIKGICPLAQRTVDLRLTLDGTLHVLLGKRRIQSFDSHFNLDDPMLEAA